MTLKNHFEKYFPGDIVQYNIGLKIRLVKNRCQISQLLKKNNIINRYFIRFFVSKEIFFIFTFRILEQH